MKQRGRVIAEMEGHRLTAAAPDPESELLRALLAMRDGDFSVRLPADRTGLDGKIADAFNEIASTNARISSELERVGRSVGREGQTRQRVNFDRSRADWGQMQTTVNTLIDDLLWPTTEMTSALAAMAGATCSRRSGSTSTAGRSRGSSCGPRGS